MGVRNYGPEVDMWSVGCILVELLTRRIAFQASSLPQQLRMMTSLLGSPHPRDLVGCSSAIDFVLSQPKCESNLPALLQSSDSGPRHWLIFTETYQHSGDKQNVANHVLRSISYVYIIFYYGKLKTTQKIGSFSL